MPPAASVALLGGAPWLAGLTSAPMSEDPKTSVREKTEREDRWHSVFRTSPCDIDAVTWAVTVATEVWLGGLWAMACTLVATEVWLGRLGAMAQP